jgi:hypothetical protein
VPAPTTIDASSAPLSLRFRRAAVRDLAWLVLDGALPLPADVEPLPAVLLDDAERAELLQLLRQWDEDPSDSWLGNVDPRLRLGLYAERLIGTWLRGSDRIELLSMNWPLRVNRITLGEADFLVRRPAASDGHLQLWELACKFYLGVPGCGWLGPELNDSLASKLARMRGHQLQLIHHRGFQGAWPGPWSAQAWLSGWLLAPAASLSDNVAAAPPPGRPASVWSQPDEASFAIVAAHAQSLGVEEWWLLPKRRWLRPVFADEPAAQRFASLAEAAEFHRASGGLGPARATAVPTDPARPMMLAGMRWLPGRMPGSVPGAASAVAAETLRVMLVPPGWAARARAAAAQAGGPAGDAGMPLKA